MWNLMDTLNQEAKQRRTQREREQAASSGGEEIVAELIKNSKEERELVGPGDGAVAAEGSWAGAGREGVRG